MLKKDWIEDLFYHSARKGALFTEIFSEQTSKMRVCMEDGRLEEAVSGQDQGIGLLRTGRGRVSYHSVSGPFRQGIKKLISSMDRLGPGCPPHCLRTPLRDYGRIPSCARPESGTEEKLVLVKEVDRSSRREGPGVIQVRAVYQDALRRVMVANSSSVWVTGDTLYTTLAAKVVAKKGKIIQTGTEVRGITGPLSGFSSKEASVLGRAAARRAVRMLTARPAPSGIRTVVLSSSAGGTMIHEAIGHSLEADSVQKGISEKYRGRTGKKVASGLITVVDEPCIRGNRGSYLFDDEGTTAQKTVLVEDGILRSYLYDRTTASRKHASSTGNGRRQDFRFRPIPRMSNTYIAPGSSSPEDIMASVRDGLLVVKMGGGEVNTATGDFVFEVEEAYGIRAGRLGPAVRGALLMGNGPEVLNRIDMVGNDLGFCPGTCGKDGQWVPVSDGQPTLRIPDILVGGTGRG